MRTSGTANLAQKVAVTTRDAAEIWRNMPIHGGGGVSRKSGPIESWREIGADLIDGAMLADTKEEFLDWAYQRFPGSNEGIVVSAVWFCARFDEISSDLAGWSPLASRPRLVREWLYDCGDRRAKMPSLLRGQAPVISLLEGSKDQGRPYKSVGKTDEWLRIAGIEKEDIVLISLSFHHSVMHKLRRTLAMVHDRERQQEMARALVERAGNIPASKRVCFRNGVVPHYFLPHLPRYLLESYGDKPDKIIRMWPTLVTISQRCREARSRGCSEDDLSEISRSVHNEHQAQKTVPVSGAGKDVRAQDACPELRVRYHGKEIWPYPELGSGDHPKHPTNADVRASVGITRYLVQCFKGSGPYDPNDMPIRLRRLALMISTISRPEAAARVLTSMAGAIEGNPDGEADQMISAEFLGSFTSPSR